MKIKVKADLTSLLCNVRPDLCFVSRRVMMQEECRKETEVRQVNDWSGPFLTDLGVNLYCFFPLTDLWGSLKTNWGYCKSLRPR